MDLIDCFYFPDSVTKEKIRVIAIRNDEHHIHRNTYWTEQLIVRLLLVV